MKREEFFDDSIRGIPNGNGKATLFVRQGRVSAIVSKKGQEHRAAQATKGDSMKKAKSRAYEEGLRTGALQALMAQQMKDDSDALLDDLVRPNVPGV